MPGRANPANRPPPAPRVGGFRRPDVPLRDDELAGGVRARAREQRQRGLPLLGRGWEAQLRPSHPPGPVAHAENLKSRRLNQEAPRRCHLTFRRPGMGVTCVCGPERIVGDHHRDHRHRLRIALAAVLAGIGGAFVTFLIGAAATNSAECDGPCFGGWWTYMPLLVGVGCGLATAWILWERATRSPHND